MIATSYTHGTLKHPGQYIAPMGLDGLLAFTNPFYPEVVSPRLNPIRAGRRATC